jgi:hypothetical protein
MAIGTGGGSVFTLEFIACLVVIEVFKPVFWTKGGVVSSFMFSVTVFAGAFVPVISFLRIQSVLNIVMAIEAFLVGNFATQAVLMAGNAILNFIVGRVGI